MNKTRIMKYSGVLAMLFLGISTTFKSDHGKYFEISKNLEIFTNMYKELNSAYVDDLDPGALMRVGIDAMLESCDPFTNYYSESDIEGFKYLTEGKYNGVGAIFENVDDYIHVTEVYEKSPANKAGLKVGDKLVAIDNQDAKGRTIDELGAILKGYAGSKIDFKVQRPGAAKPMNLSLTRDEVNIPNVPYFGLVADNIGYVALTTFTRNAGRNVASAVQDMKADYPDLKGLVFDLRGNGGGLLTEAVNVSNVFIPKGELVVTTKGKIKDWDRSFKTLNKPVDEEIPVVVLIDKNSASASEIVSGVLQDLDRAVLLGQRSYGKGLVQNTRDIGYSARIKLTTAKYYIPSGRCIQSVEYEDGEPVDIPDEKRAKFQTRAGRTVLDGGGVKPDIVLDLDGETDILKNLLENFVIYEYLNEYCLGKDSIVAVEDFHFEDWNGFEKFLTTKEFNYDSKSEVLLKDLKAQAAKDGYSLDQEIESLQGKITAAKANDLANNKELIIKAIEKEVASRYYFQKGKLQMGLRNDQEIKDAVALLNDPTQMAKILKK